VKHGIQNLMSVLLGNDSCNNIVKNFYLTNFSHRTEKTWTFALKVTELINFDTFLLSFIPSVSWWSLQLHFWHFYNSKLFSFNKSRIIY